MATTPKQLRSLFSPGRLRAETERLLEGSRHVEAAGRQLCRYGSSGRRSATSHCRNRNRRTDQPLREIAALASAAAYESARR
jgi:hypothetical protein